MKNPDPHDALDEVVRAIRRTTGGDLESPSGDDPAGEDTLHALDALHRLRSLLLTWEPALIGAAREQGVSWARLAPALGVTSRQAAERRYLRLRPGAAEGLTREERVQATRDERAGDRAVAAWARENASELRQIAGQVSAVEGLTGSGRRRARTLASSLTEDDPAAIIEPLADMHVDLVDDHGPLAAQVDDVERRVSKVRRETQRRRGAAGQS